MKNILRPFFAVLTGQEKLQGASQKDTATAHTAHASLEALREVLNDRVFSHSLPDLTPCYCHLWGSLKDEGF
jgi:hypothetical protein